MIQGDPDRLQRVFLNLIGNGADAMETGGLLEISLAPRGEAQVEIRIRDEGCGIPEEHLHRIFEPFYTTKGRDRGTGLGLLTAKAIVVDHGGTIDVESRPGSGTVFSLVLPIAGPA
jgi:signal transduction histidine kinase